MTSMNSMVLEVTPTLLSESERLLSLQLRCLGNLQRLQLLAILDKQDAQRPLNVRQLTERFGCSQPTLSHHLKWLVDAGFAEGVYATEGSKGGPRHYFVHNEAIQDAIKSIERYVEETT